MRSCSQRNNQVGTKEARVAVIGAERDPLFA